MRILLVEDDTTIVDLVTAVLAEQNYVVDVATDGESGWELVEAFPYDLVLLDIGLPKLDGIALCRRLRSHKNQTLVMLLTAQDTTTDKLLGLDAGADDYMVKPFDVQELAARIRALLRRGNTVTTPILSCGALCLDPSACEVTYAGKPLRFSRKEYLLLELFLRHQHRVFSRSAIVDQVWSFDEDPPNEDTVKSHIKSIRRKLDAVGAANLIETLYGQGYRINPAYLAEDRSTVTPAPTPAPEATSRLETPALEAAVAKIWQRHRDTNLQRIDVLKQMVEALKTNQIDLEVKQQAIQAAHKLAGSLGTFSLDSGSQLARHLEQLLETAWPSPSAFDPRLLPQVEPLIAQLSTLLSQDAASEPTPGNSTLSESLSTSSPQLLIFARDREWTEAVITYAAEQHCRTVVATTMEQLQQLWQQESVDLALIDFSLVQSEAEKQLVAELQHQVSIPTVFWAASDTAQDRLAATQLGGQLFLQKPILPKTLLQASLLLLHPQRSQLKVLVVDDDPLILDMLSACLEAQDIQVVGLQDPLQFWPTLKAVQPNFLILDVNMPGMNGLELCRTVRCDLQWNWLPIIFLTSQVDLQVQQEILSAGADDLLLKPIKPEALVARTLSRLRRMRQHPDSSSNLAYAVATNAASL